MSSRSAIRKLSSRWLGSERLADLLTACLLASGTASGLFHVFELDSRPVPVFLLSLLPAAIMLLLARFWRWALPLAGIAFTVILTVFWQSERLDRVSRQFSEFFRWAITWLQIGQPVPDNSMWFDLLRILVIGITLIVWLPLVRYVCWPMFHGILLALLFIPLLIAYPAAIGSMLTSLGGLILLLPRQFIRQVHKEKTDEIRLSRAPLQILALPSIILCLLLAQSVVPSNTRSWRWPLLVNQIKDIGDLIESQSAPIRSWQPFSISAYGFQTEGSRLGGPSVLSRQNVLRVTTGDPVLLRGNSLSIYTGNSWQRADSHYYRFGSGLWRLLQQRTFGLDQPDGPDGRAFRNQYLRRISLQIEPLSAGMATVFTAGRTKNLSLANNIDYPAYFNTRGDVFVFGGLPRSFSYTVTAEVFDRSQVGFEQDLLAIETGLAAGGDDYWPAVLLDYLQLPDDLPDAVYQAAQKVVGAAESPYAKAIALEALFKKDFVYTLTPELYGEQDDFVASFLEAREGYCIHYATAMVVMARTQGIPARLTQGFVLMPADNNKSGFNWVAAGNTAHAWAELYFKGIGWLTFDPTPGNSINDPVNPTPAVSGSPTVPPTPTPLQLITPTPPPGSGEPDNPFAAAYWLLFTLIFLLIIFLVFPLLARQRHRRLFNLQWVGKLHPENADRLEFYYKDLLRQLSCLDIRPEPGETLLDFADRIQHRLRLEGLDAADALEAVSRWRYGAVIPVQDDLDLLAGLHRRLEERLQDSLGSWSYFLFRILKTWNG